jgi:hypothetical protein
MSVGSGSLLMNWRQCAVGFWNIGPSFALPRRTPALGQARTVWKSRIVTPQRLTVVATIVMRGCVAAAGVAVTPIEMTVRGRERRRIVSKEERTGHEQFYR